MLWFGDFSPLLLYPTPRSYEFAGPLGEHVYFYFDEFELAAEVLFTSNEILLNEYELRERFTTRKQGSREGNTPKEAILLVKQAYTYGKD